MEMRGNDPRQHALQERPDALITPPRIGELDVRRSPIARSGTFTRSHRSVLTRCDGLFGSPSITQVRPDGIAPPASRLSDARSDCLSYRRKVG